MSDMKMMKMRYLVISHSNQVIYFRSADREGVGVQSREVIKKIRERMCVRRDYTRWDYDDETEITMEEQLTLEDNGSLAGSTESLANATFPPPNVLSNTSPIRSSQSSKRFRKTSMKEKVS
jgi:hypothetical protein